MDVTVSIGKNRPAMTPADSADELLPGGSVVGGRYRVRHCIGSGSMGTVYAANDVLDGRQLALKIIRRDHTSDSGMVARFQREGRLISRLGHPNIVKVFDLAEADGLWFIAMELLEGRNLESAITMTGTFQSSEIIHLLGGILDALEVAHAHRIVHRDLRPENIFLVDRAGESPHVKVLDFGVAKDVGLSAEEQLTRSGMVLGTPEFMAPEQAMGTSVDHRSDLYSVGCLAYAMLCGRPPFIDNWPLRVAMKQAFEPHLPPSQLRPDLRFAAAVDRFIGRALQKQPADRYQTAIEMRADLASIDRS